MKNARIHSLLLLSLVLAGVHSSQASLTNTVSWNTASQLLKVRRMVLFDGRLVAATPRGGLLLVDPRTQVIGRFNSGDGLVSDAVSDLTVDDEGNLWVATGGDGSGAAGLCRITPQFSVKPVSQDLASPQVTAVSADGDFVYYGTRASGVGRLSSGVPDAVYTSASHGLADDRILRVTAYGGSVWFSTQGGVSRFRDNVFTTENNGLSMGVVRDILSGPGGVFVADRSGVKRFDEKSQSWQSWGTGLADSLRAMAMDGGDLVGLGWTGTAWRLPEGGDLWQSHSLDTNFRTYLTLAADGLGRVWYGGTMVDLSRTLQGPIALLYEPEQDLSLVVAGLLGVNIQNVVSDGEGGLWVSCLAPYNGLTHWRADGGFIRYDYVEATVGFGWCANRTKFGLARDSAGFLWVSNFKDCLTRMRPDPSDDPSRAEMLHLHRGESPLRLIRIRQIRKDPQGRIWLLSEGNAGDEGLGIDIIEDPSRPLDPSAWRQLTPANSLLLGGWVRDVTFQEGGTAWISVEGQGVERWDYDGPLDDGVMRDSQFSSTLAWDVIPYDGASPSVEFSSPRQVAIAPNGLVYIAAADRGVLELRYDPQGSSPFDRIRFLRVFRAGQAGLGLLSSSATGVVFDERGALWVSSSAGLNRLRGLDGELQIDAWTTVEAFNTFQLQLAGYRGEVLSPMAGADLQRLLYDPIRKEVVMGSTAGLSRVRSDLELPPASEEDDVTFVVYPNPYPGPDGDGRGVFLSGISGEGDVDVDIYDLQGVRIAQGAFTVRELETRPVWDAKDRQFNDVASGLYLVRVTRAGGSSVVVLAVER